MNGIIVGSPVKYQGVDIGKVTNISVNPGDLSTIRVDVRIIEGFTVKTDMKAVLQYIGITLQKYIEISGGRTDAPNIPPKG
ncbi:MAG: MlaD family protein, partial [Candidatus Aminicenantes bacterium]|nr:MlaD family protein [Candidatus Aminicenantes bacterium]